MPFVVNLLFSETFYSVTDEKYNKSDFEKNVPEEHRLVTKGIEVGHIFYFGDKYSKYHFLLLKELLQFHMGKRKVAIS